VEKDARRTQRQKEIVTDKEFKHEGHKVYNEIYSKKA